MAARGQTGSIVSLICDSGERYDDTLFAPGWIGGRGWTLTRRCRTAQSANPTPPQLARRHRARLIRCRAARLLLGVEPVEDLLGRNVQAMLVSATGVRPSGRAA